MRALKTVLSALILLLVLPVTALAVAGDDPATAIPVTAGTSQYDSSAMDTSTGIDQPCGEFEGFSNVMWFSYTPERKGLTLFDVGSFVSVDGSTDFLAILFVFEQAGDGSLTQVGCSAFPATVFASLKAGTTYVIAVAGLDAEDTGEPELSDRGGTFDLTIERIRGRVLIDRFHAVESFVDEFWTDECGFEVTTSFNDRGMSKSFLSTSGERMFTFHIVGSTTYSSEHGSVTYSYAQPFRATADGNATWLGLPVKIVVDGQIVVMDVGRLMLDPDGNVVFEAGSHEFFENDFDLCGALAG